ncbi:MAG: hypothetical protein LAO31_15235 [Acidobacteriia bacterium]|nr:hypothetical protein [Terriglobia bacterium]
MRFSRLTKARILWMPGSACLAVSLALSVSPGIAATPSSGCPAAHILPAPRGAAQAAVEFPSIVSSIVTETAWVNEGGVNSSAFPLFPKDKKDKKNKHGEDEQGENESVAIQVVFGKHDPKTIRTYYSEQGSGLPPGLAKRGGDLPPGLEKQLRRNGQLPPGLEKKLVPFPVELERRLPPLPPNCMRVFVGGRGLIVDAHFHIMDVVAIFK